MPLSHRPAQTVLELVLASGVIIVSVVSSATLIISTITVGRISQNRIEATNLARAGAEIIRGVRDGNWQKRAANILDVDPNPVNRFTVRWDDSGSLTDGYKQLGGTANSAYRTVFDAATGQWRLEFAESVATNLCASTSDSNYFRIWSATAGTARYFTHGCVVGGAVTNCDPSRYCGRIEITPATEPAYASYGLGIEINGLQVVSRVSWDDRTGAKEVVAEEWLYDWQ